MEIYFITTSYYAQIYFIITSYMKYGWLWWRIVDTELWISSQEWCVINHWVSTKHDADKKCSGVFLGIHQNLWFPRVVKTRKLPAPSSERYISYASSSLFIHLITHTENEGVKGHRNEFLFLVPSTCYHDTMYGTWDMLHTGDSGHLRARKQPPLTPARDFWHVAQVGRKRTIYDVICYDVSTQRNSNEAL